jgi:hypothetical protein
MLVSKIFINIIDSVGVVPGQRRGVGRPVPEGRLGARTSFSEEISPNYSPARIRPKRRELG